MDNSNCMKLLMQQDLRIDCLNILKRALYLQNPEVRIATGIQRSQFIC